MLRSFSTCAVVASATLLSVSVCGAEKIAKSASAAKTNRTAEMDAREHVQQALLAETLGNNEERAARLTKAWLGMPNLPEANWHLLRVQVDGEWMPLSQVVHRAASDPDLQKYRELRDKAGNSAKALRDLARWCLKNDRPDIAQLHFAQLLAHANANAEMKQEAVKALDLRQVNGAWMPAAELKAKEEQAKQVEAAIVNWRPILMKLQPPIDGDDFARRDRAIEEFHKLDDPAIIPALELFLQNGGERMQEEVVKRLATFTQYEATEVLVRYAVLARTPIIRDAASAALKTRPLHEFVPLLLAGLTAPLKTRYQIVWDKQGNISYTQAFLREGSSANLLLVSHNLAALHNSTASISWRRVPGEPRVSEVVGTTPAEAFQQQLASTSGRAANVQTQVILANNSIQADNRQVFEALENSTGKVFAREPLKWWSWWESYNQNYWPRQTCYFYKSNSYNYYASSLTLRTISCFVAGTPVRTQTGEVPIESIKPGDRVLAQDQDTGELAYKVVLTTTLRPPAEMVSVQIEGVSPNQPEKIVTTLGHPFWVAGHGWKMAKELKPGDLLHQLGGAVRITAVEPAPEAPAHNLVVNDFNTYFVGKAGLLVHDNQFRKPTRAIVPGLVTD